MARLTDRTIEALKPRTARYEVWDEARKGFGVSGSLLAKPLSRYLPAIRLKRPPRKTSAIVQRKGEVMGLHAREIDYDKGLWVLAGNRAKNGREHLIPLSEAALRLLAEAPATESGYLFPSKLTGQPYRGQSIDHATRYLFDPRPVSKATKRPQHKTQAPLLAGLMERFTPHDLRPTVATRNLARRRQDGAQPCRNGCDRSV